MQRIARNTQITETIPSVLYNHGICKARNNPITETSNVVVNFCETRMLVSQMFLIKKHSTTVIPQLLQLIMAYAYCCYT